MCVCTFFYLHLIILVGLVDVVGSSSFRLSVRHYFFFCDKEEPIAIQTIMKRDTTAQALIRLAEKKLYQHSESGSGPAPSAVVFSAAVVSSYNYVRDFHRLMTEWTADPLRYPFASSWIQSLTGIGSIPEPTALNMLQDQISSAAAAFPSMFQSASGAEVSGRKGHKEHLPTDSKGMDEILVCHLSATFLSSRELVMRLMSQPSGIPPPTVTRSDAAVDDAPPVAPLALQRTPTELVGTLGPLTSKKQPTTGAKPPLSGGKCGTVPPPPGAVGSTMAPQPPSHRREFVNLGIAKAVCRPGSSSVKHDQSRIADAVQHLIAQHEGTAVLPSSRATESVEDTLRGAEALGLRGAEGQLGPAALLSTEKIISVDNMKEIKRRYEEMNSVRQRHDELLDALRSPRLRQEEIAALPVHYGNDIPNSSTSRRPMTAGNNSATRSSISHRPMNPQAVVESIAKTRVVSEGRPHSARVNWSSRLLPAGGSVTVAL